jgi:hypothetical protein
MDCPTDTPNSRARNRLKKVLDNAGPKRVSTVPSMEPDIGIGRSSNKKNARNPEKISACFLIAERESHQEVMSPQQSLEPLSFIQQDPITHEDGFMVWARDTAQ